MKKYKVALVLMVLVLVAALGAKQYSTITMGDDEWIGLAVDAGRIVFDNQTTDEVNILDARLGVGTAAPKEDVDISAAQPDIALTHTNTANYARLLYYENAVIRGAVQTMGSTFVTAARQNNLEIVSVNGAVVLQRTGGDVGIGVDAPSYDLDVAGDIRATGVVLADGRIQAGDAASDIDARADMPIAAANEDQGGYFFYTADVSADTDLTGVYSVDAQIRRQIWVRWLVYDVTAETTHYGETTAEYLDVVTLADEGANDLEFEVRRGAPPNLENYACLDVVGNHSYEVVLMAMWH